MRAARSYYHLLSLLLAVFSGVESTVANVNFHQSDSTQRQRRDLQSVIITDATVNIVPSTESKFDHMVTMSGTDNLSFHWNDISGSNDIIRGRLIHKADSIEQAPTWLGFGVYRSNNDYDALPTVTDSFMKGSSAMIGMVSDQAIESEVHAKHYLLADKTAEAITETIDESVLSATIFQHDGDDETVTTELTFAKKVSGSPSTSTELRRDGTNVFLWAVGPPGGTAGVFGKHILKGVMFLDFQKVKDQSMGTSTTAPTSTTGTSGETTKEDVTSSTTNNPADTSAQQTVAPPKDVRPNIAPTVSAQCTSTIFGQGPGIGTVPLTPSSTFSFQILSDNKIQIALEHSSTHPVWLGVASSPNGYMVGSSAIIGSPGTDAQAISPPRRYSLMDQTNSGIQESPDASLENASITSVTTTDGSIELFTLKFTKPLWGDANEPNPILRADQGTTATFLYAVGEGRELAYHQHRGAFRVDLSQCGGSVGVNGNAESSANSKVWTNHGLFAVHGFLAALAWAFFTPFAITVAWFRTLVPASWIYIHVFANVFTVILTLLAFALAVVGVARQDGGDHFSKTHHWVGTFLMAISAFQVTNGFLRPPVERKDPHPGVGSSPNVMMPPQQVIFGIFPVPRTPREAWHTTHRMLGLAALAMGIYQMQSGLKLYATRFQTTSIVNYYWMYVGIFIVSLVVLKLYVIREEDRARQGVLQAVSTIEPNPDDEAQDETVGMSHTMA
ncbi:DOmon domain containing protein [Nitzschia inconspicua]|uniref:DOmon domain containing protein n=1 Tax=Nitzschia inconspicua TaxID=303405 RepID=A0A9K3PNB3_9STRA|nr:DOmon domain containing protein [Nitzschia inconspicua]